MSTVRHYHHSFRYSYETSLRKHFLLIGIWAVFIIILLLLAFYFIEPSRALLKLEDLSLTGLTLACFATFFRLAAAYIFALILAIPLALFITKSPRLEKILLPTFDIVQSVPVLAFFPVIVLLFVKVNFFEGAAIFVLFMAMLWNIVFSMVGGLKTIPQDIEAAAFVFGSKGIRKLTTVTLPAVFPYLIMGSLLAWGQGWNILIVAEVLHNYIPGGTQSQDLYGLGSLLVNASYQGKNLPFISALVAMVILIGLMNFFIWQKLLHLAERYKFD